jgi:hypothetical protein
MKCGFGYGNRWSMIVIRCSFLLLRSTDSGQLTFLKVDLVIRLFGYDKRRTLSSFIYKSIFFHPTFNLQQTTHNFLNLQPSHFSLYFFPLMVKSNKKDQACIVLS